MKAKYLTHNRQLTFEIDASTDIELFKQLAAIQESIFDAEYQCGCCQSKDVRFLHRKVTPDQGAHRGKEFDYFHVVCRACRARFDFGQAAKGGTLFPRRKDTNGNWKPNNGWYKYQPSGGQTQDQPDQPDQDPWSN